MKSTNLKKKLISAASLATILVLTSCCSQKCAVPVLNGGYLILQKGQTFVAPQDVILVDLQVVQQKDKMITDLLRALKKNETEENLR